MNMHNVARSDKYYFATRPQSKVMTRRLTWCGRTLTFLAM